MRIISGKLKGRRLTLPKKVKLRPTTDRAKENLFNALNFNVDWRESKVLDLFSGTGNIAFEFHSRGCPLVYSVDKNDRCIEYQKKLATDWKVEKMHFVRASASQFIASSIQRFHIVFADPPYDLPSMEKLINMIFANDILMDDALVIIEHDISNRFESHTYFDKKLKYGQTIFSIFKNKITS